jgi:dipeptidyl aminopeptidase/acylaminoacyl peptidase
VRISPDGRTLAWLAPVGGAATKRPEVFACIVDLFGISNLTLHATIPPYWGPWFSIWKNPLGDPATEAGRALLTESSPTHIERAVRPILIAQGMQNVRVVAAESEQMVRALKNRSVPVTYITFADESHGFARPENRLAFYAVTEAFLANTSAAACSRSVSRLIVQGRDRRKIGAGIGRVDAAAVGRMSKA